MNNNSFLLNPEITKITDNELINSDLYKLLKEHVCNNLTFEEGRDRLTLKQLRDPVLIELYTLLTNSLVDIKFEETIYKKSENGDLVLIYQIFPIYEFDSYTDEYYLNSIKCCCVLNNILRGYKVDFPVTLDIYEIRRLYENAKQTNNSDYIYQYMDDSNLHTSFNIIINKKLIINLYNQYNGNINTIY